jgi:hypothetical protein
MITAAVRSPRPAAARATAAIGLSSRARALLLAD